MTARLDDPLFEDLAESFSMHTLLGLKPCRLLMAAMPHQRAEHGPIPGAIELCIAFRRQPRIEIPKPTVGTDAPTNRIVRAIDMRHRRIHSATDRAGSDVL